MITNSAALRLHLNLSFFKNRDYYSSFTRHTFVISGSLRSFIKRSSDQHIYFLNGVHCWKVWRSLLHSVHTRKHPNKNEHILVQFAPGNPPCCLRKLEPPVTKSEYPTLSGFQRNPQMLAQEDPILGFVLASARFQSLSRRRKNNKLGFKDRI